VITVADGFSIVASCRFLFRRITKDLFPYLHNRLRARSGGPTLAKQLEDLRGRSAERYVRALMEQVAAKTRGVPVSVPRPFRYEAEDGSKVEGGDVLYMHGKGGILLVIEVKNGAIGRLQPHSGTAEDLFKPGTPLDKSLATLARLVRDIGSGRCRVDGHDLARFTRIVPVVASREGYFQFPLFRPLVDREARVRGLDPAGAVTPVALLDFDEIELAPALEENGQSFANLLVQWVASAATNTDSFTNFLWNRDRRLLDLATSEYRAKYLTDTDRLWKLLKGPDAPLGDNSAAIPR
jgi:hypothetical protein